MAKIVRQLSVWTCSCRATVMRLTVDTTYGDWDSIGSTNQAQPPYVACPKCGGTVVDVLEQGSDR